MFNKNCTRDFEPKVEQQPNNNGDVLAGKELNESSQQVMMSQQI
jgi:hypothetical protein